MAYDLEEQEQIEGLKAFWNRYGNFILTVITVVLLAIAAWRGWAVWQGMRASQAAVVYDALRDAVAKRAVAKVKETAGELADRYGGTPYAQMGALVAAKAYADAGDAQGAKGALRWTVEHAADEEFRHVARVRLAGLLLEDKAYDEALKLLSGDVPPRFAALYEDRRGDVLLAQDKRDEARAAWKKALDALDANSPLRRLVQVKLDGLGETGS